MLTVHKLLPGIGLITTTTIVSTETKISTRTTTTGEELESSRYIIRYKTTLLPVVHGRILCRHLREMTLTHLDQ